jgi:hypothetical protein
MKPSEIRGDISVSITNLFETLKIAILLYLFEGQSKTAVLKIRWCPSTPVMALHCFRSNLSPRLRHHTHRGDWLELGDVILPSPRLPMLWEAFHSRVVGEKW